MTEPTEPDDPTERIISRLDRLIEGVEAGTNAVAAESTARRKALLILAIVGFFFVASVSYTGYRWVKSNEITCTERTTRTVQLREAIAAEFDLTAVFYDVPDRERGDLIETIEADLLERYPNPDC